MQEDSKSTENKTEAINALRELPRQIERMHRRFLDVVRLELGKAGIRDVSPVQIMMLSNIGDGEISVRDLIERGYYLGSNASYNLKQLVDCGYVERKASVRDRRSAMLKTTPKGKEALRILDDMEVGWACPLIKSGGETDLNIAYNTLRKLERCWSDAISYTPSAGDKEL